MKIWIEGDKAEAICYDCKGLVKTTMKIRDVPFRSGGGLVRNILVDVCDQCDQVVAVPPQSTPAIREALLAIRSGAGVTG